MRKKENLKTSVKIKDIISNTIYLLIIVPLIITALYVTYQIITEPNKIPDILGYKIFMILDKNMDEAIEYGDLVITKNVYANDLQQNDIIAFRNGMNTVTIHQIINIEETVETNQETNESRTVKTFTMRTAENETIDTKYVKDDKVEGILVRRIPNIGLIIYFIQKPEVMAVICLIILLIGFIAYYIAKKLDERDQQKKLQTN